MAKREKQTIKTWDKNQTNPEAMRRGVKQLMCIGSPSPSGPFKAQSGALQMFIASIACVISPIPMRLSLLMLYLQTKLKDE